MSIEYRFGNDLDLDQMIDLYSHPRSVNGGPWMIGKSCGRCSDMPIS